MQQAPSWSHVSSKALLVDAQPGRSRESLRHSVFVLPEIERLCTQIQITIQNNKSKKSASSKKKRLALLLNAG